MIARTPLLLFIPRHESRTVASHIPTAIREHYFGRHENTRLPGIPGLGDFVFSRHAVGLCYVCHTGPALFSRQCRLPTKSAALRNDPKHTAGNLFVDQLWAYCTVRFVLPDDERTISNVAMVRVCLGGRGLPRHGYTCGNRGGRQRGPSLPRAGSNSRYCRRRARGRHCLPLV